MSAPAGRRNATLLASGVLGIVGNLVAVLLLADQPSAYRLGGLDAWAREIAGHPVAGAASAATFTLGLIALAIWALELRDQLPPGAARAGALIVAIGALFDALGTVGPLVLAQHVADAGESTRQVARALLGLSLSLDALFNLSLGVGLLLIGAAWDGGGRRWLRILALAAGLASLPVGAQAFSDGAAKLLVLAAPLWLSFIAVTTNLKWGTHAGDLRAR